MPRVTTRERLKPGLDGLYQTLELMRRNIEADGRDWTTRREAELMARYVAPHDDLGVINALFEGILDIDQPPYRRDPINVELVKGGSAQTATHGEDCDGMTVRAGGLCQALGYETRLAVTGPRAPMAGESPNFSHINLEVREPRSRRWIPFDPVLRDPQRRPKAGLGLQVAAPLRARFPVRSLSAAGHPSSGLGVVQLAGWYDFFKDIDPTNPKNVLLRSVVGAIPGAGTLLTVADSIAEVNTGFNGARPAAPSAPPAPAPVAQSVATVAKVAARFAPRMSKRTAAKKAAKEASTDIKTASAGIGMAGKVLLGVAGVGLVGGIVFALTRKKSKKARR